jgi:hypothetical protein
MADMRTEKYVDGKWVPCVFEELKVGDRFRQFFPDGDAFTELQKEVLHREYIVESGPFPSGNTWGVSTIPAPPLP